VTSIKGLTAVSAAALGLLNLKYSQGLNKLQNSTLGQKTENGQRKKTFLNTHQVVKLAEHTYTWLFLAEFISIRLM